MDYALMAAGRVDLLDAVRQELVSAGFAVSDRCDLRPVSFDVVARREKDLLMVKVLANVDALSDAVAQEIKVLCRFLEARPLLVGLRAGSGLLEDGVVYARHDIPILTPGTLHAYLTQGDAPMVYAAPGGFYVQLDGQALRRVRDEMRLSLGALAQMAGVSRRTIQMYEEGMSASIDAAMRLEEFLQPELIRPIQPFKHYDPKAHPIPENPPGERDPMEDLVRGLLEAVGYQVRATHRSPFQAISVDGEADPDHTLLTGLGRDSPQLRRRARVVASVSRITGRPGFFVVERTTRTQLEGTPVVSREELESLHDPEKILRLILERAPR